MPKGTLLKRWNDWSAGVGHLVDDGQTPGMYSASGLLGLRGELRPAPSFITVTTSIFQVGALYTLSGSVAWKRSVCTIAPASGATVAVSGTPSDSKIASNTTLTYEQIVPAGSNRAIYVTVHNDSNADPTSVTFDGDALTRVTGVTTATERVSIWRRVNPTATTANVVITFAGATAIISSAVGFTGVHQSTPETAQSSNSATSSGPINKILAAEAGGAILMAISFDDTAKVAFEDFQQTSILSDSQGTMEANASYKTFSTSEHQFQYFFEETATKDPNHPFLYAIYGLRTGPIVTMHKIDLSFSDFSTFESGSHSPGTALGQPGQPGKYQGYWWLPNGNDLKSRKLSTIGIGDVTGDVLDGSASSFVPGVDHHALLGDQLVGHVKEGIAGRPGLPGIGDQDGGVVILKVDGAPATADDWGPAFPVGEITERAAGLITLGGMTFVLNRDGLYSFNKNARAGEVFTDLRQWQNPHVNIPMSLWYGGICIPHPGGFLYYVPGERPIPFGVGSKREVWGVPPSGVTEIHSGLYHSSSVLGDFQYSIYQPDLSSTTALVLVAYGTPPHEVIWQSLGTITLNDAAYMAGIHAATSSRQAAANRVTPTLWFGNGADLNHLTLDPRGGPFRARGDPHKVTTSADADMSELRFTEPVELTGIVVHTSRDMIDGDEFQISIIVNGASSTSNVGHPVRGSGTYHELPIDRKTKVTSLSLHVNWTASSSANRVPPVIQAIELFGNPSIGKGAQ